MPHIIKLLPEAKAAWVKALRSGKFPRGRGALKTTDGGYCCYGVQCEIMGLLPEFDDWGDGRILFENRWDNLPPSAFKALCGDNAEYKDGRLAIPVYSNDEPKLIRRCIVDQDIAFLDTINDAVAVDGSPLFTFDEIANLIEERL